MKNLSSPIYIREELNVTPEDVRKAESIENDPEKMLLLIDLLFLCQEEKDSLPS